MFSFSGLFSSFQTKTLNGLRRFHSPLNHDDYLRAVRNICFRSSRNGGWRCERERAHVHGARADGWHTQTRRQRHKRKRERKKDRNNEQPFSPYAHISSKDTHSTTFRSVCAVDLWTLESCLKVVTHHFFNDLCVLKKIDIKFVCSFLILKKTSKFEIFHVPASQSFVWTDKKFVVEVHGFERRSIQWSTRYNSNKSCLSLQIIIRVNCVHKHTKEQLIGKTYFSLVWVSFSFFSLQLCWTTITRWHEL